MRISDWSSDVCSSDLRAPDFPAGRLRQVSDELDPARIFVRRGGFLYLFLQGFDQILGRFPSGGQNHERLDHFAAGRVGAGHHRAFGDGRSEEPTSELQSLMRTSLAVSGLKKKTTNKYKRT